MSRHARKVRAVVRRRLGVKQEDHFDEWGEYYLDSDKGSRTRNPVGVKVPAGPFNDILRAWHGELGYEPALVQAPVALIRGEWDGVVPDEDARWLFDAFKASPIKRDIKISRGTHLMHLEIMRGTLYHETNAFLLEERPTALAASADG
jgi:pimeloyl-ACP methyl ester carboxylesterase